MIETAGAGGQGSGKEAHHLVLNEEDLAYEEEILRNPNMIKPWIRYIEHKADSPRNILNLVFERALKELPGSYKLWYNYLKVNYTFFHDKAIYRAFHIILDYLQALKPKYSHNTRKTYYFLHGYFYIYSLYNFLNDHSFSNLWLVPKIAI